MAVPKPLEERIWDPASDSLAEALNLCMKILKIVMVLLVLLFLGSGIFTVEHNEVAMVLRFGKVQGTMADRIIRPGLRWNWPYPFSEVVKIAAGPTHSIILEDFWYYAPPAPLLEKPSKEKAPRTLDPELDGYCLTGDTNIIHSRWQVRYKIRDAYEYAAKVKEPEMLLRYVLCQSIVEVSAYFTGQDAISRSDELRHLVEGKAKERLVRMEMGMELEGMDILQISPPRQVREAFESVVRTKMEYDKKLEEANNYREQLLSTTEGEYAKLVAEAESKALEIEKETASDAAYFEKLLVEYRQHPQIIEELRYQDVVERLHERIQEWFLLNESDKRELRIQINRNPELYRIKPKPEEHY